jgi:hypothetical protein
MPSYKGVNSVLIVVSRLISLIRSWKYALLCKDSTFNLKFNSIIEDAMFFLIVRLYRELVEPLVQRFVLPRRC